MIDHELGDGVNHSIDSFDDHCLFVVNINEGKSLVDDGLVIGVLYLTELVGVYDGC